MRICLYELIKVFNSISGYNYIVAYQNFYLQKKAFILFCISVFRHRLDSLSLVEDNLHFLSNSEKSHQYLDVFTGWNGMVFIMIGYGNNHDCG